MLASLQSRSVRPCVLSRQSRRSVAIRAQAQATTVTFKIHRHVAFGQTLVLVGGPAELGSWDALKAVALEWSEGDNWTAQVPMSAGSSAEYKYIIKRKDGLDWCPGSNRAVALPSATAVEVLDSWENSSNTVSVLTPADTPAPAEEPVEELVPTPVTGAAVAEEPVAEVPTEEPVASPAGVFEVTFEVTKAESNGKPHAEARSVAVSTVENVEAEELESILGTSTPPQQPPPAFLANNIVQSVPMGAVAVGQDPITQYEEADKYQVLEVGSAATATAVATAPATKHMDKMTVSELKTELKRRGMSSFGTRRELVTRLQSAGL